MTRRRARSAAFRLEWADRRAPVQALRVRLELSPADHGPRWVATRLEVN
jgi:hypothetical protein